jgi:malonate-semialdehyde dehydrogenase (acetylating)/methylmalonate-semialdehyde dehydrogenase
VKSPYFGSPIASIPRSDAACVARVVSEAKKASSAWAKTPLKERCQTLLVFRQMILEQLDHLSYLAALESGKTIAEGRAGVQKGIEVLDFAVSSQNMDFGHISEVSRGVACHSVREPLGVVAGITPFNFPAMVPMWMIPLAIVMGNAFVLKPSEKVPLTATELARLASKAGIPNGIFCVLHGDAQTARALVEHEDVKALAFVGSTPVAKSLFGLASTMGKRSLCLGGAKNCLMVAPDCDPELTAKGILASFTGCAGQRCMAASLLIMIDSNSSPDRGVLAEVLAKARTIRLGQDMGAIISAEALASHHRAIVEAKGQGAVVLLDGREAPAPKEYQGGYWLGPTILDQAKIEMSCAQQELFGPILTVVHVKTLSEAMAIEASLPYGNATSIFTNSGKTAKYVAEQASAGMVGINIGVPVPREPFSFGGTKASKFGHGDITGLEGLMFWSHLKKVSSKWSEQADQNWMS